MSQAGEIMYGLALILERSIRVEKLKETTQGFYNRYYDQYIQMLEQGIAAYLPQEMKVIEQKLNQIKRFQQTDPYEARDVSMGLGQYIHNVWMLSKIAKKQFEANEKERIIKLKESIQQQNQLTMKKVNQILDDIKDPIVKDFAYDDINQLRAQYQDCQWSTQIELELRDKVKKIETKMQVKAEAWKQQTIEKHATEIASSTVEDMKSQISSMISNVDELAPALKSLSALDESPTTIVERLTQIVSDVDDLVVDEAIRKETTKILMKTLKEAGFILSKPKLVHDVVEFKAKRPSGNSANIKVELDGKFTYKFHDYEGSSCKKDIDTFKVKLEDIYGVKIKEERVTWENPDRISKGARPIDNQSHHNR